MAKVKAIKEGYYDHRLVRAGEILDMKEVDKNGVYVDSKGKPLLFGEDGKPSADGKGKQRKCKWVDHVGSDLGKAPDPKEVAKVLSGRSPGHQAPAAFGDDGAKE